MSEPDNFADLRSKFETFYYQKLWPKLFDMEESRRIYLHRFWMLFCFLGIGLPSFIIFMWGEWIYSIFTTGSSKEIESILKLGLLVVAVIVAIIGSPIIAYKMDVKDSIIKDFINFFGNFKHYLFKEIDDDTIKKSLLVKDYNRHSCDDYFCGTYKNTSMVIAEEHLAVKRRKGETSIFDGIMIMLDFPKSFKGQTVVMKDWKWFNFIHQTDKSFERIALEDVDFENEFEVYGNDQIEARYLLTAAFMERMLKVRETFRGKKIQFSFFDNKLFIAIETSKDMFEPASLFKCSTNRGPINDVFEQFISVFAIVEFLKLTQQ